MNLINRSLFFLVFTGFITMAYTREKALLISAFDPFDGAQTNNSWEVGKVVVDDLVAQEKYTDVEIKFCLLPTVYGKAHQKLQDCFHEMQEKPRFILSLGEGPCSGVKIETAYNNWADGTITDNLGVIIKGEKVVSELEDIRVGATFPMDKLYCDLTEQERKFVIVSRTPGTFVCNYFALLNQMSFSDEVLTGFIHVPDDSCLWGKKKVRKSIEIIKSIVENIIEKGDKLYQTKPFPIWENTVKDKYKSLDNSSECFSEFWEKLLDHYSKKLPQWEEILYSHP